MPDPLPPILESFGADLAHAKDTAPHRRRRFATRRPRAILVAVVLAASVGTALGIGLGGSGSSVASAASVLAAAARAAAHGRVLAPSDTVFFYTRTLATTQIPIRRNYSTPVPRSELTPKATVTIETWETWSLKRRGAIVSRVLGITFPTAAARARWERLGRPQLPTKGLVNPRPMTISPLQRIVVGHRSLTAAQLLSLAPDPQRLYDRLLRGEPATTALDAVRYLDVYPISPKLRAAFYSALALVPGIRLYGHAESLTHHRGVVIGATDPREAVRDELIIDPRTGNLLGERTIVLSTRSEGLPAGSVFTQTALLSRGISPSRIPAGMPR